LFFPADDANAEDRQIPRPLRHRGAHSDRVALIAFLLLRLLQEITPAKHG
jgi:hypothetical protein